MRVIVVHRLCCKVSDHIAPRLTIGAATALPVEWLGMEPAADRHGVLLRFRIPVARPGAVRIRTQMFPYDPMHQTFVNVYEGVPGAGEVPELRSYTLPELLELRAAMVDGAKPGPVAIEAPVEDVVDVDARDVE